MAAVILAKRGQNDGVRYLGFAGIFWLETG